MELPQWLGGPVEPASNARQGAHAMREMFVALTEAGFTEEQATTLLVAFVTSTPPGGHQ